MQRLLITSLLIAAPMLAVAAVDSIVLESRSVVLLATGLLGLVLIRGRQH